MKIAIFGAGVLGQYLYGQITNYTSNIQVLGFIDNHIKNNNINIKINIYTPDAYFSAFKNETDAVFIAAGAQKTVKLMINTILSHGLNEIYMIYDIVGRCKLPIFDENRMNTAYVRKIGFSKKKPTLHYFEVPVTDSCNLNCKGCLFACNEKGEKQHMAIQQIEKDAYRMAELFFDIPWIRILGGEPLLHPEINSIFEIYRMAFPYSEIDLCTNGLLFPKKDGSFFQCLIDNRISIHISGYKPTYQMIDKIDKVLKKYDLPYVILKRDEFQKYYNLEAVNNMEISHKNCIASGCHEIYNGRLSNCSAAIAFEKLNQQFNTSYKVRENMDWFDIYATDIDIWKIKERLDNPTYICKYCSDHGFETFEWNSSMGKPQIEDYII